VEVRYRANANSSNETRVERDINVNIAGENDYFTSPGIRKGVMLQKYVQQRKVLSIVKYLKKII